MTWLRRDRPWHFCIRLAGPRLSILVLVFFSQITRWWQRAKWWKTYERKWSRDFVRCCCACPIYMYGETVKVLAGVCLTSCSALAFVLPRHLAVPPLSFHISYSLLFSWVSTFPIPTGPRKQPRPWINFLGRSSFLR